MIRPGDDGFVPYANGRTYVGYCVSRDCPDAAVEMVGPALKRLTPGTTPNGTIAANLPRCAPPVVPVR
jgi:hypothetical protein